MVEGEEKMLVGGGVERDDRKMESELKHMCGIRIKRLHLPVCPPPSLVKDEMNYRGWW